MASEDCRVYHERQKLQFCLLHALNNLFQVKDAFTRAHLNAIAEKLVLEEPNKEPWTPLSFVFKPHHNTVTGNYDINVLISAVEEKGKSVVWHDHRNGASSIDLDGPEDTHKLMGIVLNVPVRRFGGVWKSRHWVALRKVDGLWYNLDSDLPAPHPFKDTNETVECHANKLLLVRGSTGIRVLDLSSNSMTIAVEQRIEKQNSSSNRARRNRGSFPKCRFRSLKGLQFSPLSFLKHLADKVTRALHLMALKRRPRHEQPAPTVPVASSKPLQVSAIDSHRTEALEDCIKYINSST